jgi:TPM domain
MFKHRASFLMPLVAFAALAVPQLEAAEVRDRAGIFTTEAVKKAETVLDRIERRTKVAVVIETIEAIPGLERDASASEKRRAVDQLAEKRAREIGYEGVYLLISKNDHVFSPVLVKERYESLLPAERRHEIRDTLAREFKGGHFDDGLFKTTALLDSALAEAPAVSGPRRAVPGVPATRRGDAHSAKFGLGTLLVIGLGIVGVLLLLRVLGGIFGQTGGGYSSPMGMGGMPRPGMGPGPGYGPGYGGGYGAPRGGFFSGMLGGLGGALAGNWLYDQFSGRHGGLGQSDAGLYPSAEAPASADRGGDDFVGGNDDGGQGTSWDNSGGADTGGGDWGGGDGGGDWGGGGGDWGGGGGDWGGGGDGGGW